MHPSPTDDRAHPIRSILLERAQAVGAANRAREVRARARVVGAECVVSSPVLRVGVVDVLLLLNAPCCDTVALTSPCVRAPQAEAKSAAEAKAATEKAAATAAAAAAATAAPAAAAAAKV